MAKEHLYKIVTDNPHDMLLDIIKRNVKPSTGKGKELQLLTPNKYDLSPITAHVDKIIKNSVKIHGKYNKTEDADLSEILHRTLKAVPVSELFLEHGFWFWLAAVRYPKYTQKRWFYKDKTDAKLFARLETTKPARLRYMNPGTNRGFEQQCFARLYLASNILYDPSLNTKNQYQAVENVFSPQDVWTQAIDRDYGLLPNVVRALTGKCASYKGKKASLFAQETGKKLNNLAGTLALDELTESEIINLL